MVQKKALKAPAAVIKNQPIADPLVGVEVQGFGIMFAAASVNLTGMVEFQPVANITIAYMTASGAVAKSQSFTLRDRGFRRLADQLRKMTKPTGDEKYEQKLSAACIEALTLDGQLPADITAPIVTDTTAE